MNRLTRAVVMLRRGLPEQIAHLEIGPGVLLKPIRSGVLVDKGQQFVQQAGARHAVAQPRLVGRQHEQHLVHQQLRVVRIVGAAQPEQQVDFVDAGEIAGIGAAVFLSTDAIRLVVRPHRVEEPLDVELRHAAAR